LFSLLTLESLQVATGSDLFVQTPRLLEVRPVLCLIAEGERKGGTFLVDPRQPAGEPDLVREMLGRSHRRLDLTDVW
jgi:hypothetical protein